MFRWTKKFDIFDLRRIYCPINIKNSHWTLIVVYVEEKRICYYDSTGNSQAERYLNGVRKWIQDVAVELEVQNFDIDSWITEFSPQDLPRQRDSFSCGVFLCAFANLLTDDIRLGNFSEEHLTFFRRKLCLDILNRRLSFTDNPMNAVVAL